jgi:TRAP-type C4-dicarboxylate transport system permease small subunit
LKTEAAAVLDVEPALAPAPDHGVVRLLLRLERAVLWVNSALFCAGLVTVLFFCFSQAADRYTIKSSFDAHDQLARIGLVWLVFSGMAVGYAQRDNLRIDLFFKYLPARVVFAREALFEAAVLATSLLIHWKAWLVMEVSDRQQILGTPFTNLVPHSAILLSTATIALVAFVRLVRMAMARKPV